VDFLVKPIWVKMMVVINLKVLFSPGSRMRGLEILRAVVGPLQGEPGFVRFNLFQAIDDENAVTFEEVWKQSGRSRSPY